MTTVSNAITISNFSFTYTGTKEPALTDINLEVKRGAFIVLAGRSGCGKSTLLRCLNGIIPHLLPGKTGGDISIFGKSLADMTPETISKIAGSVFQNPRSQFFHINVTDEVAFGPESQVLSRTEIISRVDEAFDLFEINPLRGRKMYELSSGEQQKVAFAAIYAAGADIFFLDEPSANLDYQAIENLKRILGILKQKGKTIIVAEHKLYYSAGLFDEIIVLEDGRLKKSFSKRDSINNSLMLMHGLRAFDLKALIQHSDNLPYHANPHSEETNLFANNVFFSYPKSKKIILNDLSLKFFQGEKVAIIGPNGSGKTTLTKLIAGLLTPTKGVFQDGSKKRMTSRQRLQSCGLVLQENSHQLFYSTVLEELTSARTDNDDNSPIGLLRELGLEKLKNYHPQNLSAGQQQRLVFAIAAINSPRVLILDEPTSGLDAASMKAMGCKITEEAEKKATVLIVTHDFEFVSYYCDAAILVGDGKILRRIERADFKSELLFPWKEKHCPLSIPAHGDSVRAGSPF